MKLHRFNETGLRRFDQFLVALNTDPSLAVPSDWLVDPVCVEFVHPEIEIVDQPFANRRAAADYLDNVLVNVTDSEVSRDVNLWAWLTLFYFDQICPRDGQGKRKVGERARYIPAVENYQKYYRHLLAGPYRVIRAHRDNPDRAQILLCGPLHKPGEIVEQIVARQEIITNPYAVELATSIYYDSRSGSFKRGAAGKGDGSARRLADILNQFDVTWDLYWMRSDDILAKLPGEFERFRVAAAS